MKRKYAPPRKLAQSFWMSRLVIWPMVLIGWGMAFFAMFLTLTHTGLQ